jgi:hypothetical protein
LEYSDLATLSVNEGSAYLPKAVNDVVGMTSLAFLVSRPEFAAEKAAEPEAAHIRPVAAVPDERGQQFGNFAICP